jgi:hypothetical protein
MSNIFFSLFGTIDLLNFTNCERLKNNFFNHQFRGFHNHEEQEKKS